MPTLWLIAAAASAMRLPPVDQCETDPAFVQFRSVLEAAVAGKDVDALAALMDDRVRLSFGGRRGKADFREMWASSAGEQERLWSELGEVLALGCAVHGNARVFPAMFVQAEDMDGFTTWVARPGARLRSRPSLRAPIRARLSWDVLIVDNDQGGDWLEAVTASGRRGFVHRAAARSVIDYRLFAEPRDGSWRITAFIAGD